MRLAVLQMNVGPDKAANLARVAALVAQTVKQDHVKWVGLPEMFSVTTGDVEAKRAAAETIDSGETARFLQNLAREHKVTIHAGSIYEALGDKLGNTTLVYNPRGERLAVYRKIHLFDAVTPAGLRYCESAYIQPGDELVTYECEGITIGCTICYDLRFPELFQALRHMGAQMIAVPAAFTRETGAAHWHTLLRARAIETQCCIAAPAQCGSFQLDGTARPTYGHALIADAWGAVVAECEDGEGYVAATLDVERLARVRACMPVAQHRRFTLSSLQT